MAKMRSKDEEGLRRLLMDGTVDLEPLQVLEADGYLTARRHPRRNWWIWNYTDKAQYDQKWTREVLMCRGLITDDRGRVIARPFKKFFNFEEHLGPIPDGPYEVWEKVDGSLGILYWDDGVPFISTRGSFESEMAAEATKMLRKEPYRTLVGRLDPDFTHLFEIIYPGNRIVVDYGDRRQLVYLGAVHTAGGWEITPSREAWPHIAEFFSLMGQGDNPLDLKFLEQPNREGFVLRWPGSGLRLKLKFNEYIRLHSMIFRLNARTIWEALRYEGRESFDRMASGLPDEHHGWAKEAAATIESWVAGALSNAERDLRFGVAEVRRRDGGLNPGSGEGRGLLVKWLRENSEEFDLAFGLLDGKDYYTVGSIPRDRLWHRMRPKAVGPFEQVVRLNGEEEEE